MSSKLHTTNEYSETTGGSGGAAAGKVPGLATGATSTDYAQWCPLIYAYMQKVGLTIRSRSTSTLSCSLQRQRGRTRRWPKRFVPP